MRGPFLPNLTIKLRVLLIISIYCFSEIRILNQSEIGTRGESLFRGVDEGNNYGVG